jgi:hypothetical protein
MMQSKMIFFNAARRVSVAAAVAALLVTVMPWHADVLAQSASGAPVAPSPAAASAPAKDPVPAATPAGKLTPALANRPRTRVLLADRIVAIVNDEVVTQRQLEDRMRVVRIELRRGGVAPPPDDVLEKQVLERIIVDRAQDQFGRNEIGIRIDEPTLDNAIAGIARGNNMTMAQFRDVLEQDGIPFSRFREDIRADIMINRVRQSEVDRTVVVSEAEIDDFVARSASAANAASVEVNLFRCARGIIGRGDWLSSGRQAARIVCQRDCQSAKRRGQRDCTQPERFPYSQGD